MERTTNRFRLPKGVTVITVTPTCMGRPPKPESQRRSKLVQLRLTPGEIASLEAASRKTGESVSDILRKGAALYMEKGKGGSPRKEKKL